MADEVAVIAAAMDEAGRLETARTIGEREKVRSGP